MNKLYFESPCNNNCKLNEKTDICEGCGRTIQDIEQWHILSDDTKIERNIKALNRLQDD